MNNIYFNYDKIFSYSQALLYFIIGERGVGKTYGFTKHLIKHFLKTGKQFAYIRRYKSELKESVPKFFSSMIENNEFPKHKLESKNNQFFIDGKLCGYAFPLSTAKILKGSSFNNVDIIFFDEFLIEKGCYHYLQNEVKDFLSLIETICRLRDIKCFLLANAVSQANPYFDFFDLSLPFKSDIKTFKNGLIVLQYIQNEKYREVKKLTKFGQLVKGTEYEEYAINNKFIEDNTSFIKKRKGNCRFMFILFYNSKPYGIWLSKDNELYISKDYNANSLITATITEDDHKDGTILLKIRTSPFIQSLLAHYRLGSVFFESLKIKNEFKKFFNKYSQR